MFIYTEDRVPFRIGAGFWLRRNIDGTSREFLEVLIKLLGMFDAEWLAAHSGEKP